MQMMKGDVEDVKKGVQKRKMQKNNIHLIYSIVATQKLDMESLQFTCFITVLILLTIVTAPVQILHSVCYLLSLTVIAFFVCLFSIQMGAIFAGIISITEMILLTRFQADNVQDPDTLPLDRDPSQISGEAVGMEAGGTLLVSEGGKCHHFAADLRQASRFFKRWTEVFCHSRPMHSGQSISKY